MTDILLVFPPQWSPFQPALSLPSLSAWLKRARFEVASLDLNVLFYEWLLSDDCAAMLASEVANTPWSDDVKEAYLITFRDVATFRNDIHRLRSSTESAYERPADYAARNYVAIKSLETYLFAVSSVSQTFTISPYEFRLTSGNLNANHLEEQVAAPPGLIARFLRTALAEHILPFAPKLIGLSCIGQEQLYFTLLLGSLLKHQSHAAVLVGGTIFSRIFERGVLQSHWFDRYFDIIVRNEGERPTECLLSNVNAQRPLTDNVPGIVYRDGTGIVSSLPCAPLGVADLPIPDFDDLPLGRYISSEITLPLLSARGCYWGKCEFCHHGMVYGEKYAPYQAERVLETVRSLATRYGVKHFAFNDEALPPKTARAIAGIFPPHRETGWTFTGLMKFEPYYKRQDFDRMHDAGFRSLYVGLESASERVLNLMKKKSKRETIVANLTDATQSGIWMHCFLFFGFPGEREEDALETYEFIVSNSDIVSSFGAGTFSLEHNAPIFHHYEDFGVRLTVGSKNDVDVYYSYDAANGISADRALEWQQQLTTATADIPNYIAAKWVPRELLLCMLSIMTPEELRKVGLEMRECGGFPATTLLPDITTRAELSAKYGARMVINRLNGRALILKGAAARLFDLCYEHSVDLGQIQRDAPMLFEKLAFLSDRQEVKAEEEKRAQLLSA